MRRVASGDTGSIWAGGLLSILVVVSALTVWFRRTSVTSTTTDLAAVPLTTYPGFEYSPSFSPDGTQVAFSWNGGAGTTWISTSNSSVPARRRFG